MTLFVPNSSFIRRAFSALPLTHSFVGGQGSLRTSDENQIITGSSRNRQDSVYVRRAQYAVARGNVNWNDHNGLGCCERAHAFPESCCFRR